MRSYHEISSSHSVLLHPNLLIQVYLVWNLLWISEIFLSKSISQIVIQSNSSVKRALNLLLTHNDAVSCAISIRASLWPPLDHWNAFSRIQRQSLNSHYVSPTRNMLFTLCVGDLGAGLNVMVLLKLQGLTFWINVI